MTSRPTKVAFSRLILLPALLWLFATAAAFAESPLAVLRSEKNQGAYSDQHIGEFEDDWSAFKRTFETANVRYDLLKDSDLNLEKLSQFKVLVVPLLVDIPANAPAVLKDYIARGGKIILTDGCGNATPAAQEVMQLAGAQVSGHQTLQEASKLIWPRNPFPLEQDFAVGTLTATLQAAPTAKAIAHWTNTAGQQTGVAVASNNGNAFVGWAPGMQGELTANEQLISLLLEEASPGISQQAAVQISYADYQTIQQELDYLQKRTDEVVNTAKQADLAVPFKAIQSNYDEALAHVQKFNAAYKERRFYEASEEIAAARHEFALAFAKAMPVRPVETRAVWLDRGTIIACKNEQGMIDLLEKIKNAGINCVYFETNNAGFTMYPSSLAVQNPQLGGWDAFGTALRETHSRGMEFHAWFWNFNVGNERHNPIIGKESDYPGPVLSNRKFSWALAGRTGSFLAHNQHEYWLDPANPEAKQYAKDLMVEVLKKYPDIDGVQYDYIRYPFNGKPNQMGFDWVGRLRFERETGLSLDALDDDGAAVFQAWRVAQVNNFVKETSESLRSMKPGLRISAAVYGYPRRLRGFNIQQEWETWIQRGWVDTINPMTYVGTAKELQIIANNCRENSEDKALVFPGLSIRQLDTAGFIEQLDTSRAIGTLGTTLFAVAQLDDKKCNLLKIGPYRRPAVMTAQADSIKATTLLFDDFAATVNRYCQDPKKRVISDTASTNEVLKEMEALKQQVHALTNSTPPAEISKVRDSVVAFHNLVKDWLRIEAFAQRGFRAQYIISYLSQIESILAYAAHKTTFQQTQSVAGASASSLGMTAGDKN